MSSNTVAEFATELKKSPETLLDQLKAAGVGKAAPSDALTESDKQKLLAYLQASHGTASADRKKITLVKKSTSEIKQADATGKARTIQVEVGKKRPFIQRDEGAEASAESHAPAAAEEAAVSSEDLELSRREEEARRQAELIRRQETELAEKRAEREAREKREREAEERAAAYAAQEAEKKAQASAVKQEATRERPRHCWGGRRCARRWQGSEVGQAVLQLGQRHCQEKRNQDPWRQQRRCRSQQLAWWPAWPPWRQPRPSRRSPAVRTGRGAHH